MENSSRNLVNYQLSMKKVTFSKAYFFSSGNYFRVFFTERTSDLKSSGCGLF